MEKLTTRNEDGLAMPTGIIAHVKVLEKLAHYEDLEEQLLKSAEIDIESMIGEFMHYYNLKKENKLIELPCKVGTKVFYVQKCLAPSCKKCMGFTRVNNCYTEHKARIFEQEFTIRHLKAFGETVFLTKAEAEKALEEMEK